MTSKKAAAQNFTSPLWSSVGLGVLMAGAFYALIGIGLLDYSFMRRYAMGHPVSIATVFLFGISIAVLSKKLIRSFAESRLTHRANDKLLDLLQSMPDSKPLDKVRWLDSMWRAQDTASSRSYFGNRFTKLLRRLIQRGEQEQFDKDLQELADDDAVAQHEAYAIVRIICWAMPMLGFLGTVVGISQTLGNMDMKLLATGDESAMDALTAGLYVAFDTTAVGLVLTIAAMFFQFVVSGLEMRILRDIDSLVADRCYSFLKSSSDRTANNQDVVQLLAKSVVDATSAAIEQLLQKQTSFWANAMERVDRRWSEVSLTAGAQLTSSLASSLNQSLETLGAQIQQAQQTSISSLDTRYQQWQTTLSDQTRCLTKFQDELVKQSELLVQLVENCNGFQALDQSVQQTLGRMTNVDRFHEAAVCMTEAIAVLGIQLERSGAIGKMVRETPRRQTLNLFEGDDSSTKEAA